MAADPLPAFFCSITCDVMRDPVIAADGFTYERDAIEKWLESQDTSPGTGAVLPTKHLIANIALRQAIEEWEERYALKLSLSSLQLEAQPSGAGAFKTVWKGKLTLGGSAKPRAVAVLKMRKGSCETEARIFLKLGRHPRLVRFYGQCTDGDDELIVTELARYGSLSDAFETLGHQMTRMHDVVIMQQISQGMEHLVAEGMFHRDLAARNVLLFHFEADNVRATSVKVADFGLSMHSCNQSRVYAQGDTEIPTRYLSPEALQRGRYSEKSDVWAFGVTCWELLTRGKIPFYDMSKDSDVVRFVCGGGRLSREEVVGECAGALWEVVWSCWAAESAQRPTFAELTATLAGVSPSPATATAVLLQQQSVVEQQQRVAEEQRVVEEQRMPEEQRMAEERRVVEEERMGEEERMARSAAESAEAEAAAQRVRCLRRGGGGGEGVEGVLAGLREFPEHPAVQAAGCRALGAQAAARQGEADRIAELGGVRAVLVGMRAHGGDAGVQEAGCAAVASLALHSPLARLAIAPHPGPHFVLGALRNGWRAVRNRAFLTDESVQVLGGWGVKLVLGAMRRHEEEAGVQEAGCEAVRALALNADYKVRLAEEGAVPCVLAAMSAHPSLPALQAAACGALANLAFNPHSHVTEPPPEAALDRLFAAVINRWRAVRNRALKADRQGEIGAAGGVEAVVRGMRGHVGEGRVQEAGCRALANLAAHPLNHHRLAAAPVVHTVLCAMRTHAADAGVQAAGCGAVWNLARSGEHRARLVEEGAVEEVLRARRAHRQSGAVQRTATEAAALLLHWQIATEC